METQVMENNNDILNQFMKLMSEQNMGEQAKDINYVLLYIVSLQAQMMEMTKELQGIKDYLNTINKSNNDIVSKNDIKMISGIQKQTVDLSKQSIKLKKNILNTIKYAVNTYKTNSKEQMEKVLVKGISSIKHNLLRYRYNLENVTNSCREANQRLDAIGNELTQIGYSIGNVGKLVIGKDIETLNKRGEMTLTRQLKIPINKVNSFVEKQIDKIDKMIYKLENVLEKINAQKILNNKELSTMDKAEKLINFKDYRLFSNNEKKFIMNYADKMNNMDKVYQLIGDMESAKNTSIDSIGKIIDKYQKELDNIKGEEKESVLNKLHSNQEKVKSNEQKGEERIVKRDELQK